MAETEAEAKARLEAEEAARKKAEDDKKNAKTITEEEHRKAIAEVVEEREANKKKYRETRDKLKELEDRLEKVPSTDELQKILKEKKELEDYKKKIEADAEAAKLKDASELDKLKIQMDKIQAQYEATLKNKEDEYGKTSEQLKKDLDKLSKRASNLLGYKRDMEILRAAEKYGAYKPQQIVNMLASEFKLDEDTETYFFEEKDDKGKKKSELTIDERIKSFLENPENDNLLKASVKSGSDTKKGQHTGGDTDTRNKYTAELDKKTIEREAEVRGLKVEEWLEIKKKQEERAASKLKKT